MEDKEMIELAAKASGIRINWSELAGCYFLNDGLTPWSPIDDDGDAFCLAVELDLFEEIFAWRAAMDRFGATDFENTRRAITRAAAEIVRTK